MSFSRVGAWGWSFTASDDQWNQKWPVCFYLFSELQHTSTIIFLGGSMILSHCQIGIGRNSGHNRLVSFSRFMIKFQSYHHWIAGIGWWLVLHPFWYSLIQWLQQPSIPGSFLQLGMLESCGQGWEHLSGPFPGAQWKSMEHVGQMVICWLGKWLGKWLENVRLLDC